MAVSAVGTTTPTRATSGFTAATSSFTAGQTRTAGNLLVAVVCGGCTTVATWSTSENSATWTKQLDIGNNAAGTSACGIAVFTKTAAGSDAPPAFTTSLSGTGAVVVALWEFSGANTATPVDTTGKQQSGGTGTTVTFSVTTTGNVSLTGEYGISVFTQERSSAVSGGWTESGTGWTSLYNGDAGTTSVSHNQINIQSGPAAGAALSDAGNWVNHTSAFGTGAVVVIAAGAQQGTAALTGAGSLSANVVQRGSVTLAGAGFAGGAQPYGDGTYGGATYGGSADVAVTLAVPGTATGAGSLNAALKSQGSASLTGAGTVNATGSASVHATASLTGTGTITAPAVQRAPVTLAGAGALTAVPSGAQQGTATLTGAGAVTAAPVQSATAPLTGAGVLTATPGAGVQGTATLIAEGFATANAVQLATAALPGAAAFTASSIQSVQAALTGAGTVIAISNARGPFYVAKSISAVAPRATGSSSVTDPRDGTPGVT